MGGVKGPTVQSGTERDGAFVQVVKNTGVGVSRGYVAITTNRALDSKDGWKLLNKIEVENPCIWGSMGYISNLEKE